MSEQRFTDCEDLIIAAAKLYATGFSATARMYLSFHNPTLAPQFAGAIGGLLWAICQSARRYLHAEIRQDFFRLVFVDIHDLFLKTGAAEWGGLFGGDRWLIGCIQRRHHARIVYLSTQIPDCLRETQHDIGYCGLGE